MVAVAIGVAVPLLMGRWSTWVFVGITLAAWVAVSAIDNIRERGRNMKVGFSRSSLATRVHSGACTWRTLAWPCSSWALRS